MRLFDLHCDTLYEAHKRSLSLEKNALALDFSRGKEYRPWIQAMAVWMPRGTRGEAAAALFRDCYGYLERALKRDPTLRLCRDGADLAAVEASGGAGVLLTVEGGSVLEGRMERVAALRECGVRALTLTWNDNNELGGGCGGEEPLGLTAFGRGAVREMERQGIAVDVSHASDLLFDDVCQCAQKPFLATHSNAREICHHRRNLTADQFCEIARRGGVVGLNLYPCFLNGGEDASFDDIYRHLDYFWGLGGQDTVALGSDFDGAKMPSCLQGIEDYRRFYDYLLGKNIPERLIGALFFGNAYRFFTGL